MRPTVVNTRSGVPGEDPANWYGIARMWVHEANVEDEDSEQRFMKVRASPSASGYTGALYWVRQFADHAVDDEVLVARLLAEVGEKEGKLIYMAELVGGGSGQVAPGQYQYMVYQVIAQNESGWDWTRAHPDI